MDDAENKKKLKESYIQAQKGTKSLRSVSRIAKELKSKELGFEIPETKKLICKSCGNEGKERYIVLCNDCYDSIAK